MDFYEFLLWLVLGVVALAAVRPLLRRARRARVRAKWAPVATVTELWALRDRQAARRRALEDAAPEEADAEEVWTLY